MAGCFIDGAGTRGTPEGQKKTLAHPAEKGVARMNTDDPWIVLGSDYDVDWRRLLWIEYQARYQAEGSVGRRTFFVKMCDTIRPHIERFVDGVTRKPLGETLIPVLDDSAKVLDRYLATGLLNSKSNAMHKFVDAYLRIASPERSARTSPTKSFYVLGEMLADFMRSPRNVRINKEESFKFAKAYSYDLRRGFAVSSSGQGSSLRKLRSLDKRIHQRYLVISRGTTSGYFLLADMKADQHAILGSGHKKSESSLALDLHVGISAHSEDATSIHLRSLRHEGSIIMSSTDVIRPESVASDNEEMFRLFMIASDKFFSSIDRDMGIDDGKPGRFETIRLLPVRSPFVSKVLADKVESISLGAL